MSASQTLEAVRDVMLSSTTDEVRLDRIREIVGTGAQGRKITGITHCPQVWIDRGDGTQVCQRDESSIYVYDDGTAIEYCCGRWSRMAEPPAEILGDSPCGSSESESVRNQIQEDYCADCGSPIEGYHHCEFVVEEDDPNDDRERGEK